MNKDFLISFMIEDKTQEDKVLNVLDNVILGYNVITLNIQHTRDNENYNYIHARFNNVKEEDIIYIKHYISRALPDINKVW